MYNNNKKRDICTVVVSLTCVDPPPVLLICQHKARIISLTNSGSSSVYMHALIYSQTWRYLLLPARTSKFQFLSQFNRIEIWLNTSKIHYNEVNCYNSLLLKWFYSVLLPPAGQYWKNFRWRFKCSLLVCANRLSCYCTNNYLIIRGGPLPDLKGSIGSLKKRLHLELIQTDRS